MNLTSCKIQGVKVSLSDIIFRAAHQGGFLMPSFGRPRCGFFFMPKFSEGEVMTNELS